MDQVQQTPVMMYGHPGQDISPTLGAPPPAYYQPQDQMGYPTVQPEPVYVVQDVPQVPTAQVPVNMDGQPMMAQQVYHYDPNTQQMMQPGPMMDQGNQPPQVEYVSAPQQNQPMYEMPAIGHPNPIYGMQPGGTPMPLTIDPAAAATTEGPYGQVVMYPPVVYPIVPPQENIKPAGARSMGGYTQAKKKRNCC